MAVEHKHSKGTVVLTFPGMLQTMQFVSWLDAEVSIRRSVDNIDTTTGAITLLIDAASNDEAAKIKAESRVYGGFTA